MALYWPRMGSSLTSGGRLRRNTPCCVCQTCSTRFSCWSIHCHAKASIWSSLWRYPALIHWLGDRATACPANQAAAQKHSRRKPTDARFETMLGRSSWVDSLFVWFPASWMPLVVDALREKSFAFNQHVSQLGAVAFTDRTHIVLPEASDFTYNFFFWTMLRSS